VDVLLLLLLLKGTDSGLSALRLAKTACAMKYNDVFTSPCQEITSRRSAMNETSMVTALSNGIRDRCSKTDNRRTSPVILQAFT